MAYIFDGNYYLTLATSSYQDSKTKARQLGGTLVAIESQEENQFIVDNFSAAYWAIYAGSSSVGGTRYWDDGSEFGYTNWQPTSNGMQQNIKIILIKPLIIRSTFII